jgi:hypothetical protein
LALSACVVKSSDDDDDTDGSAGRDGGTESGGTGGFSADGESGGGGSPEGSAGADEETAGRDGGGGAAALGGAEPGEGGAPSEGGAPAAAGAAGAAGAEQGEGGTPSEGGAPAAAGAAGAAGAEGGAPSEGGAPAAAGAAGAAGAEPGEGGSPGAAGAPGAGGSAGVDIESDDTCDGAEGTPNNDRDSATAYTLGTRYHACLQDVDDIDYYEFTIPADSRGGYVMVSATDVGPNGDTRLELYSLVDLGLIHVVQDGNNGRSVYFRFNAKPGASFYLGVTSYDDVSTPNPYVFEATYIQVPDVHEPNDTRPDAAPISVGEPVQAYMFAGWENSTGIPAIEWFDWYQVELDPGAVEILLDIVASDIDGQIQLFSPLGTLLASAREAANGSSVLLESTIEEAGTHFIRVDPYDIPSTIANSSDATPYLTTPYTLTVTQ